MEVPTTKVSGIALELHFTVHCVVRDDNEWMAHFDNGRGHWGTQSLSQERARLSFQRDALSLLFEDQAAIDQFLVDDHPKLADFRGYVRLARQYRHQALAMTIAEFEDYARLQHPHFTVDLSCGEFPTVAALHSSVGYAFPWDAQSPLFQEVGGILWPFSSVDGGCEVSLFALHEALRREELIGDCLSSGAPEMLKQFPEVSFNGYSVVRSGSLPVLDTERAILVHEVDGKMRGVRGHFSELKFVPYWDSYRPNGFDDDRMPTAAHIIRILHHQAPVSPWPAQFEKTIARPPLALDILAAAGGAR